MRAVWICSLLIVSSPFSALAEGQVKVNMGWEHKDFEGTVELYEVKGRPRLWETKSVKSMNSAPIGDKIKDSAFMMESGRTKRFALVVRNNTDKPVFFFAAPHVVSPAEHSLGFRFRCLCINHAFHVGPRETWYRIVEFQLSNGFFGRELTVTHSIIGIDQKRAESFSKGPVQPDF